jgi:putative ABC transport system permease protein
MPLLPRLTSLWRNLFHKSRAEQDLTEEIRAHLEMLIDLKINEGLNPDEAHRAALIELGGEEQVKDNVREVRVGYQIDTLWQDLRYGARSLRRTPGFTAVAVLTLALGIGATTALFSLFNALLFRALPYRDSDRLVRVYKTIPQSNVWQHPVANHLDHKAQNTVFEHMAAFTGRGFDLVEPGQPPETMSGMAVSADFFPALGVHPILGRVFTAEEDQPGRNQVVVISHGFWRSRFAGDPNIVGRTLRLAGGSAITVIGVMPAGFDHAPLWWGKVDAWQPIAFTDEQRQERKVNTVHVLARLKPGVSLSQAQGEMSAIAARLAREHAENNTGVRVIPLKGSTTGEAGSNIAYFALGLTGFVLLIACVNLANLQMARAAGRSREYVIRAALGARRSRLMCQSLTESLLLAVFGGAFGIILAAWASRLIGSRLIIGGQVGIDVPLDSTVMLFSMLITMLAGVAFGTSPAWIVSRVDVNEALKQGSRGTTAHRSQHRLRHGLIVAEVALALVLLTGAGLFVSGLYRFTHIDSGWRVEGLLTGYVGLPDKKYPTDDSRRDYYDRLQARLATLPGVERAAISMTLPLWGLPIRGGFVIEGRPEPPRGEEPVLSINRVSTGYFDTLGMRLIEGRDFTTTDAAKASSTVIINEAMARRFWPGESAIGKRFHHLVPEIPWQEVAGVVSDIRFPGNLLSEPETRFQMYEPLGREPRGYAAITLRGAAPPEALVNAVRRAVAEIDPDQPVSNLQTAQQAVERSLSPFSVIGSILVCFALLGLLLAAVGIYGVMSGFVVQRTSEIGVRVALGAQMSDVLWLVLGKGLRLALLGSGIGLVGAVAIARLLAAIVPRLPAHNLWAVLLVAALQLVVVALACYLPARRAARMDPLVALRHD